MTRRIGLEGRHREAEPGPVGGDLCPDRGEDRVGVVVRHDELQPLRRGVLAQMPAVALLRPAGVREELRGGLQVVRGRAGSHRGRSPRRRRDQTVGAAREPAVDHGQDPAAIDRLEERLARPGVAELRMIGPEVQGHRGQGRRRLAEGPAARQLAEGRGGRGGPAPTPHRPGRRGRPRRPRRRRRRRTARSGRSRAASRPRGRPAGRREGVERGLARRDADRPPERRRRSPARGRRGPGRARRSRTAPTRPAATRTGRRPSRRPACRASRCAGAIGWVARAANPPIAGSRSKRTVSGIDGAWR